MTKCQHRTTFPAGRHGNSRACTRAATQVVTRRVVSGSRIEHTYYLCTQHANTADNVVTRAKVAA